MAVAKFERQFGGGSVVYTCDWCGKRTRKIGDEPRGICNQCYEEAGYENEHNDHGPDHGGNGPQPESCPLCR